MFRAKPTRMSIPSFTPYRGRGRGHFWLSVISKLGCRTVSSDMWWMRWQTRVLLQKSIGAKTLANVYLLNRIIGNYSVVNILVLQIINQLSWVLGNAGWALYDSKWNTMRLIWKNDCTSTGVSFRPQFIEHWREICEGQGAPGLSSPTVDSRVHTINFHLSRVVTTKPQTGSWVNFFKNPEEVPHI